MPYAPSIGWPIAGDRRASRRRRPAPAPGVAAARARRQAQRRRCDRGRRRCRRQARPAAAARRRGMRRASRRARARPPVTIDLQPVMRIVCRSPLLRRYGECAAERADSPVWPRPIRALAAASSLLARIFCRSALRAARRAALSARANQRRSRRMTDDEVLAEFRAAEALLEGHFILSSGLRSAALSAMRARADGPGARRAAGRGAGRAHCPPSCASGSTRSSRPRWAG